MKRLLMLLTLAAVWASAPTPVQAEWVVQAGVTTAVYHIPSSSSGRGGALVQRTGRLEIGPMWRLGEDGFLQLSLPVELTASALEARAQLHWPSVNLRLAQPTIWGPRLFAEVFWSPRGPQGAAAELGLQTTWDPLLTYAACSFAPGGPGLKAGVIFAANRSWALGAHLDYRGLAAEDPSSSLAYQVHYNPPQGPAVDITYTYHLHAAQQRLGLKLIF